jgi:hypothetical protein
MKPDHFIRALLFKTSVKLRIKFPLLPRPEGFEIYSNLKYIHERKLHRGRWQVMI